MGNPDGEVIRCSTLRKRRDFLLLSAKGKKFVTSLFVLQLLPREPAPADAKLATDLSGIRIGYTVTKKIGNAVVRNHIKRRFREGIRQTIPKYGKDGQDYVLIARHKAIDCRFSDLLRDLEFAFSRIHTMKVSDQPYQPARKRRK